MTPTHDDSTYKDDAEFDAILAAELTGKARAARLQRFHAKVNGLTPFLWVLFLFLFFGIIGWLEGLK